MKGEACTVDSGVEMVCELALKRTNGIRSLRKDVWLFNPVESIKLMLIQYKLFWRIV